VNKKLIFRFFAKIDVIFEYEETMIRDFFSMTTYNMPYEIHVNEKYCLL